MSSLDFAVALWAYLAGEFQRRDRYARPPLSVKIHGSFMVTSKTRKTSETEVVYTPFSTRSGTEHKLCCRITTEKGKTELECELPLPSTTAILAPPPIPEGFSLRMLEASTHTDSRVAFGPRAIYRAYALKPEVSGETWPEAFSLIAAQLGADAR
jgi:hypothetical protein